MILVFLERKSTQLLMLYPVRHRVSQTLINFTEVPPSHLPQFKPILIYFIFCLI